MGVGILIGLLAGLPLYGVLLLVMARGNRRALHAAQSAAEEAAYYAASVAPAYGPGRQAPLPQPPAGAYLPADYGWENVPEPWIEGEAYEIDSAYPAADPWAMPAEAPRWDDTPTQPYPAWEPVTAAPRRAARILGN
jgi:hypothetical protein